MNDLQELKEQYKRMEQLMLKQVQLLTEIRRRMPDLPGVEPITLDAVPRLVPRTPNLPTG